MTPIAALSGPQKATVTCHRGVGRVPGDLSASEALPGLDELRVSFPRVPGGSRSPKPSAAARRCSSCRVRSASVRPRQIRVSLDEIEDVGYVAASGVTSAVVWIDGKRRQLAAPVWLPAGWRCDDLVGRILLRKNAMALALAASEVATIEVAWDTRGDGVAVRRSGEEWRLLAVVENAAEFEAVRVREELPDEAELILADDVMPSWRELQHRVAIRPR